jgi:hypothetical protein
MVKPSAVSERNQYDGQHHQQEANQSEMDPDQERSEKMVRSADSVVPPALCPAQSPTAAPAPPAPTAGSPLRSSITDIMVKIEVNSTIMMSAPG